VLNKNVTNIAHLYDISKKRSTALLFFNAPSLDTLREKRPLKAAPAKKDAV
jgi:hypothetical protein